MMSDAVTVPPGLLIRTMTALTSESSRGLLQLLAKAHEQRDARRRRADDQGLGLTFLGEKSRDVHQEDLRSAAALDGPLLERLDPWREVDRDESSRPRAHGRRP